jgi:sulfatase maturation enzyme AslB (radical SAM superfamily)
LSPCKDCELRYICGGGCRIDEFPDLVNRDSFENIDFDKISQRECDSKVKDKFYDMLIRSNKYFYTAIENN